MARSFAEAIEWIHRNPQYFAHPATIPALRADLIPSVGRACRLFGPVDASVLLVSPTFGHILTMDFPKDLNFKSPRPADWTPGLFVVHVPAEKEVQKFVSQYLHEVINKIP